MTLPTLDQPRISVYDAERTTLALDPALFTNAPMLRHATLIDGAASWADAIERAGLDFEVVKRPVAFRNEREGYTRVGGVFATVRTDQELALGLVKDRYTIVQNRDAGDLIDTLLDDGSAKIVAAGSFKQGATGFAVARIPADVLIAGESVHSFLVLSWSHDGTRPLSATVQMIRAACANVLPALLGRKGAQRWSMRHVGSTDGKIAAARQALAISFQASDQFSAIANGLLGRKMTIDDIAAFTEVLIPNPKGDDAELATKTKGRREAIVALAQNSPNLANVRGTAWATLNAVAEYADHFMVARETKQTGRDENRAASIFDGQAARLKARALSILIA